MKVARRIVLEEALISTALLTAAWYLYYLLSVGTLIGYLEEGPLVEYATGPAIHIEMIVSGIGLGAVLAVVNRFTDRTALRLHSLGRIILVKSVLFFLGLAILVVLVNVIFVTVVYSPEEYRRLVESMSPQLAIGLTAWAMLSTVGVNFIMEVRRKIGPGNLWALLVGRYHRPREEHLVFLFIDLKGSTSITEALGHARYSEFIRQVYHDLTEIVLEHGARIYQYVGDEVVLTWSARRPDAGAQCLHAFFAFSGKLAAKAEWYRSNFGAVPEFRGGVDAGEVTAAEVGDLKRDIAYHGDPLNTAARLLELSSEYSRPVLVSGRVRDLVSSDATLATEATGELTLRGQSRPVPVYGVALA